MRPDSKNRSNGHAECHVLVVDDEPDIRTLLAELLRAEGYQVETATDGVNALERIHCPDQRTDLVISDIMMPRLDGISLAHVLADEVPSVPVILLSAVMDQPPSTGCPFISKPFELDHLLDVVDATCSDQALTGIT